MKRATTALVVTLLFVATASTTWARTQVFSGPCPLGGTWVTVITVDDNTGRVTDREGIACGGHHWIDHCSYHPYAGTPSGQSVYSIEGNNGSWWVRFNLNPDGSMGRMWGMDAFGTSWEADNEQGDNLL